MNKTELLILFVKAPVHGQVKTRLSSCLDRDSILNLYKNMVEDLLENVYNTRRYDLTIYYWPAQSEELVKSWLTYPVDFVAQAEGDLGRKMSEAFRQSFESGYQKVLIIGSDLPTIGQRDILNALHQLEKHEIVLGPTIDGGYYLIGLKSHQPALFINIHWSTTNVLRQTRKIVTGKGLSWYLLEEYNDIDYFDDLKKLWHQLEKNKGNIKCPKTFESLQKIFG